MPDFATTCVMMAASPEIFVCENAILALKWFCSLVCVQGGGVKEPQGSPIHEKNFNI